MRILVTGATGYVGGRLVPRLLERGHEVVVLVRDRTRIAGQPWGNKVEILEGDLLQPQSLPEKPPEGLNAAYYLVHSMTSEGDFAEADRQAVEQFVRLVRGVGLVVYLGGIVPKVKKLSRHLASRAEVGRILRERLPTTEIQAGPIIGSGSASFEMVRYLTERLPVMVAPRWIMNQVQPIAVRDILGYLLAVLDHPPLGCLEVGTTPLSFRDMMEGYARVRGLRRFIFPLPVLAPRLAARWVGLVTPIPNTLAVPLVEGVVHPVVGDNRRALKLFPGIDPLPYEVAVEKALERIQAGDVETRWSGALGGQPTFNITDREGMMREVRSRYVRATPEQVYQAFTQLGGERGWLRWQWLWWFRGVLDRLIGGPGLRRGRRHPTELMVGEAVDFWRVEALEPGRMLRLRAEMKVPGKAWLEWFCQTEGQGTRLVQSALFEPRGLPGALYWYAMVPAHQFIFNDLINAIADLAERRSVPGPGERCPGL